MSNIRVMFVGQGGTGLPEDRFVNVFHFVGTSTYEDDALVAAGRVINFYNALGSGQTNPIASYLSPFVNRLAEVRTYDLTTAKPRVPTITTFTLAPVISSQGLPEEVALCSSYFGSPPITARRRGRIYIGPFNHASTVLVDATTTVPSHPATTLVLDLQRATQDLALPGGPVQWCVRSSLPSENFVPIVAGYIDNAFDTQRRRGPDATTRQAWTNAAL